MSPTTVSFSVVTYNSEKHIGKLLDSLFACVTGIDYRVYVIDNGSTDGTAQLVKDRAPRVTLIQADKNIGFGAAHNLVLDRLDSRYHVIVNPDVYIDRDVITPMAAYMDAHPDIGLLSPKLLFPDGRVQAQAKRDPKPVYLISRRLNLKSLRRYRDDYEMAASSNSGSAFDIEFASGCFMFVRTLLLKKAGGFDQRYFLYFEDADLSRELRRFARIEYNPEFSVYHNWERGGAKDLWLLTRQIVSMFKYMKKWKRSEKQ